MMWEIAAIAGFIFLSAFFNGAETAFLSLNRVKMHSWLEEKKGNAKILEFLSHHSESMLSTLLITINFCDVSSVLLFTNVMLKFVHNGLTVTLITILVMTPVVTIFATLIPKAIFREFADGMMYTLAPVFLVLYWIIFPLQALLMRSIRVFLSLLGFRKKKGLFTKDEFHVLIDMTTEKGLIQDSERSFIESIMNFKNVKAHEIMIPLIRMTCVEENDKIEVASALMLSTKHARLPVFRMRVDNMIGYIDNKAIIDAQKADRVGDYIKPAIFIPDSAPVNSVLVRMQEKSSQMGFVVDEYGGVVGVLTNQDIITEIIGDLVVGHEDWIVKEGENWIVNGSLDIEELNDKLNLRVEKAEYETVAGFVLQKFEKIPMVGESFDYGKYTFEVTSVSNTRVKQVRAMPRRKKERKNKRSKQKHVAAEKK
jgi:CBS domain containing-hemolysin-like protein